MSVGKGLVRVTLNAIGNYFLPEGLPGIGDMLLPSEKKVLEDIYYRCMRGEKLTPKEQELFKKHFLQA